MTIWLVVLLVVLILLLFIVRITSPAAPALVSDRELDRLAEAGDNWAVRAILRRKIYPFARALQSFLWLVLLLGIMITLQSSVAPVVSAVLTIGIAVVISRLAALRVPRNWGQALEVKIRPLVDKLYDKRKYLLFIPYKPLPVRKAAFHSESELLEALDGHRFIDNNRKQLIRSALEFSSLDVADAMSPRRSIHAVDKAEVLGPLLLDELYKTGRQTFVVTDGELDNIVGILYLDRLTSLDLKDTPTALKAMNPEVHMIDADSPITEGLTYLRSSRAPFLVVKDGDKTVGLLGMDNILRCLFETS